MRFVGGLREIIDRYFGLEGIGQSPHHKHIKSCKKLSENPPKDLNASILIKELYQQIVHYHKNHQKPSTSIENWRFKKIQKASSKNKLEVGLERRIVCCADENWVNQVPTIAGVVKGEPESRTAIDLVHRINMEEYEFIELKVASNTPLYTAMEITLYGLFYVFYRANLKLLINGKEIPELLNGKIIHLKVLAPQDFYVRYELKWFEDFLNEGWRSFLKLFEKLDVEMDFQFEVLLLDDFSDTLNIPCPAIQRALDRRVSLYIEE